MISPARGTFTNSQVKAWAGVFELVFSNIDSLRFYAGIQRKIFGVHRLLSKRLRVGPSIARWLGHGSSPLEYLQGLGYLNHMLLKAIVHPAEAGGFWAEVPALPGCLTQGETLDELQANLREAIELWLSVEDDVTAADARDTVLELTV